MSTTIAGGSVPHTPHRSRAVEAAMIVATLTLTACGGPDDPVPEPPLETYVEPSPAPTALGTGPVPATANGTTLPATESAVLHDARGDRASDSWTEVHYRTHDVRVEPADEEALAEVVVSGGPPYDPETEDAFYLRARHELLWAESSHALDVLHTPHLMGWTDQGERSRTFMVGASLAGPFECADEELIAPELGTIAASCNVVTVPAGQTVVGVGTETGGPVALDGQGRPTFASVLWLVAG